MRVYYFIPEDGDQANHPNAFDVSGNTPTVATIKQCFPLQPNVGEYFVFRFKYKIKHVVKFVWLDILQNSTQAPRVTPSSIFMKVSRMTEESPNKPVVKQSVTRVSQKQPRQRQPKSVSRATSAPAAVPKANGSTRSSGVSWGTPTSSAVEPAAVAIPKASAPTDPASEVNLFGAETDSPKYEGFICPSCKGNLSSPEELLSHQPFCPGPPSASSSTGRLLSFGGDLESPASPNRIQSLLSFSMPEKKDATADLSDLNFDATPAPAPAAKNNKGGMFANFGAFSM